MESKIERKMPKSYLSKEEELEILSSLGENMLFAHQSRLADEHGDSDTAWEWLSFAKLPTHSLKFIKRCKGSEFIIKKGFDTSEADKQLGKKWL